jgi:hypothetical protein
VVLVPKSSLYFSETPSELHKAILDTLQATRIPFLDLEEAYLTLRLLSPAELERAFPKWKTTVGGHFTSPVQHVLAERLAEWVKTEAIQAR